MSALAVHYCIACNYSESPESALTTVAVGPAPGFGAGVGDVVGDAVAVEIDDVRRFDQLGDKPRAACKDVLGADLAIPHGVELVDVGGLALRPALDDALARIVVFVGLGVTVVGDLLNAALFVPHDRAPRAVLDVIPAGLVAVQVVAVGAVPDERRRVRLG